MKKMIQLGKIFREVFLLSFTVSAAVIAVGGFLLGNEGCPDSHDIDIRAGISANCFIESDQDKLIKAISAPLAVSFVGFLLLSVVKYIRDLILLIRKKKQNSANKLIRIREVFIGVFFGLMIIQAIGIIFRNNSVDYIISVLYLITLIPITLLSVAIWSSMIKIK